MATLLFNYKILVYMILTQQGPRNLKLTYYRCSAETDLNGATLALIVIG
jgi:hypothetical protein